MSIVLKTTNLTKTYGVKSTLFKALDNINLEIKDGEFLGIMGPSGAGKTTLLNLISTIDQPTTGEIYFEEKNIGKFSNNKLANFRKENIGFIFQDFNLLDNMTIEDNIALPLALGGKKAKDIVKKVQELAAFFKIDEHLKKYPYQLSGG